MVKAKKTYKKGGKVVAQGADRADKKADRKAARLEKRKDKAQLKEKKAFAKVTERIKKSLETGAKIKRRDGRITKVKSLTDGEKYKGKIIGNRSVHKQKNKSEDGVRSTRKTVYGGNAADRLITKEKQRTNRKGKKAGMLNFKDKAVDRKDFSVRRKTKGIDPRGGA